MRESQIIVWLIILILIWTLIEQKLLVTKHFIIKSRRLPEEWNHTNFVVLADLHNCSFGRDNERLIKKIDKLAPDYILVPGDMVNKRSACCPSNSFSLLESLAKKYKIYYSYGNHEEKLDSFINEKGNEADMELQKELYSSWTEYRKELIRQGIIFLDNQTVCLTKNGAPFYITGISLDLEYFGRHALQELEPEYLKKAIGKKKENEFQILMAHSPFYFKDYMDWGADLVVSGHVHGGMVRLPGIGGILSPQVKFFPKYHAGLYRRKDKVMLVSRGLGSHSVMPRLFNIPEIISIRLEKE
ncbi:MAG TPA: metallophosphoesterase [Clostridiales bacterium]|nr:metallophosphoesterase [Clostridiales bacterium]